ncbi:hypothetical protein H4582DRAFT_1921163 [Lactarius indigo]|nr:hypothetical protein H4582DRAFT_1921163 [Lactarius indigo]
MDPNLVTWDGPDDLPLTRRIGHSDTSAAHHSLYGHASGTRQFHVGRESVPGLRLHICHQPNQLYWPSAGEKYGHLSRHAISLRFLHRCTTHQWHRALMILACPCMLFCFLSLPEIFALALLAHKAKLAADPMGNKDVYADTECVNRTLRYIFRSNKCDTYMAFPLRMAASFSLARFVFCCSLSHCKSLENRAFAPTNNNCLDSCFYPV